MTQYFEELRDPRQQSRNRMRSLHWCLDVTYNEDHLRMRKDHSAENMAVVRHIVLNLLKQHPSKMSIARKRRRYAFDDAFLLEILASIHA